MDAPDTKSLPENAYSPLAPGEVYTPIVPARVQQEEATFRSVGFGLFLCVVFTIASAYSGLKVGQVMEASIPISILAIGLARVFRRRSTLLENVIMTTSAAPRGAWWRARSSPCRRSTSSTSRPTRCRPRSS